jgi:sec-independent protein translocase protein TatB
VFGFSFSELVVVVIVALVVMGPKDLPKMLRRVGQWAGKIRRAAADLRAQSGIDDALRSEGLSDDIAEIRKLARGELDAVQRVARLDDDAPAARATAQEHYGRGDDFYVTRDREYPRDGADAYGALPDNAIVYAENLPRSVHARDPLYVLGDADGELPPEPTPAVTGAVGPTLMGGIGLAPAPQEAAAVEPAAVAPAAVESEETVPMIPGAVGPTLMGVGLADADAPHTDDESKAGDDRAHGGARG